MSVRPATHAGSWYSADRHRLSEQLRLLFDKQGPPQKGARVLIGPHAGYTYCAARLAETYSAWDTSGVERVFVLGPSHHVYFSGAALLSRYDQYATPLGPLKVDRKVCKELACHEEFKYMLADVDEEEHLFEMHAPCIAYRAAKDGVSPTIIPIMILALDESTKRALVEVLEPYFADQRNTFVISSDFCHWGRRFHYTKYVPGPDLTGFSEVTSSRQSGNRIYELIEVLDRLAMEIASGGGAADWDQYISTTGNTICGQKPISVVLRLVEQFQNRGGRLTDSTVFNWLGYSQSSQVERASDSSVSYALGYVRLES